jgi:branched chain amino acid efflux pump
MSAAWITIVVLIVVTATIKAAGPVVVGGRELPRKADLVIALLAPVLLAALILTETFTDGEDLTVDARAAGLACAGASLALRLPLLVTILVAAIGTAATRALT